MTVIYHPVLAGRTRTGYGFCIGDENRYPGTAAWDSDGVYRYSACTDWLQKGKGH